MTPNASPLTPTAATQPTGGPDLVREVEDLPDGRRITYYTRTPHTTGSGAAGPADVGPTP